MEARAKARYVRVTPMKARRVVDLIRGLPADRAIFAPPPGRISIAWMTVPVGIERSGRALPGLMSAPGPFSTLSPCCSPCGQRM